LVSAWELRNAGFDCTVFEARERPGWSNWSLRRGNKIEFPGGTVEQRSKAYCIASALALPCPDPIDVTLKAPLNL
jgi:monoamine oxidase